MHIELAKDIISLRNADMGYPDRRVLTEVNFRMSEAEFCYLVGHTGSGKTSLLKTLYGALPLLDGDATVCDYDLKTIKENEIPMLRRKIGMVFQDFNLFEDWTAHRNLDFVLKATDWTDADKRRHRVEECLNRVRLSDKSEIEVYKLSGGQKQKLAIARAILNHSKLIIADEPTGNLDVKSTDEILYLLRDISQEYNAGILLATHDQRVLKKFTARVYRCEHEGIVEEM